jgi:hypothetical protein
MKHQNFSLTFRLHCPSLNQNCITSLQPFLLLAPRVLIHVSCLYSSWASRFSHSQRMGEAGNVIHKVSPLFSAKPLELPLH